MTAKKMAMTTAILVMFSALPATEALAQGGLRWRGGGGWGPTGQYGRMYDPKTVETISGEVVSVEQMAPPRKGMGSGVHLMVKTDKDTISVHLGPQWYIERQDTRIRPKDKIEVKGSRITFDNRPGIIAAEVHKGDEMLILRDANGVPAWAGWRGRQ